MTDTDSRVDVVVRHGLGPLRQFAQSLLNRYRVPSGWLQADDVVQYAVAELLERQATVDNPEAYLRTVARRFVLRAAHERQHFTEGVQTSDQMRVVSVQPAPSVEDQVEARVVAERVYQELAALPLQQSRALYLVTAVAVSRAEAATMMGTAEGTVSSHLHRGMSKLRAALGCVLGSFATVAAIIVGIVRGAPEDIPTSSWPQVVESVTKAMTDGRPWWILPPGALSVAMLAWAALLGMRWRRRTSTPGGGEQRADDARRPGTDRGDPHTPVPSTTRTGTTTPQGPPVTPGSEPLDTSGPPAVPGRGFAFPHRSGQPAEPIELRLHRARQSAARRYE